MTTDTWSVPEIELVQRIERRLDDGSDDVLATIVDVEGNAYRRPGGKSLLAADGSGIGSITPGCLEDDLATAAASVRERGRPELVTYDLMEGDDDAWGLGIGCNGIIDVLLEPLTEAYRPAVDAFADGRDVAVCTALESAGDGDGGDRALSRGDRAYYHPDEDRLSTPAGEPASNWPAAEIADATGDLASRGTAGTLEIERDGATLTIFVDVLAAPDELVIFGTGNDVAPVTEFGSKTGFRVCVVGFRGAVDLEERFPHADRTLTTSPARVADDLDLGPRTHAVVMTHNFLDDRLTVEALLDAEVPYIGLMGPHERFEQMLEAFEADGRTLDRAELESVYTPIGLDLGDGSPYGIAHSIVAEVLAVANDRTPRHLREREGHIHERVDVDSEATVTRDGR
ncbi:XdhC family protein [Natrialbaceae archaeon GCM10025810]|uniref:XdhC family protein n=1 Tax=Halovalidus salilacus TaxID=3075124 RepID=UPI003622D6C2